MPQGGDPYNGWGTGTLPESLRDTGRGFWNAGIGIVEGAANLLGGFTIPGASDYVPFLDGFRAEYEAPKFGAIIEFLGTVGTLKVLGEIGAASRTSRPPSLSPDGAGRSGAFNEAKRRSGIPTSQQPSRVLPNVDNRGNPQPGRIYEYEVPAPGGGTKTVRIRDDAAGHDYGVNDPQNRGPHFNDESGNHYDY